MSLPLVQVDIKELEEQNKELQRGWQPLRAVKVYIEELEEQNKKKAEAKVEVQEMHGM
jgi:hypothetical protein